MEGQDHALAFGGHVEHFALAEGRHFNGGAAHRFGQVDHEFLNRLTFDAIDFLDDDLGIADLQFVAFAAHGFDQDRKVQHASAKHAEGIGRVGSLHAERQVLFQFLFQAILQVARGHKLALLAKEGGVVNREHHAHGGLVDGNGGKCFGVFVVGYGIANLKSFYPVEGADFASFYSLHAGTTQAVKDVQFFDAGFGHRAVALDYAHGLVFLQSAAVQATDGHSARIGRIVQRRNEQLGRSLQGNGLWNVLQHHVHQGLDGIRGLLKVVAHPILLGRTVYAREVELLLRGVQGEHKVKYGFVRRFGIAVWLVDFVDDDDGLEAHLQGLLKHEAGLGHGAFKGVDQQQYAVGHVQNALDLTAKVGVAWGVNDVDLNVLVPNADILGENGDTALTLQIVVVQNQFPRFLVAAEELAVV